ncbi:MAG: lytic transglycosylase domain-containing protein [Desulfuromonadaceae bacterium]
MRDKYYQPLTTAVLGVCFIIAAVTAGGLAGVEAGVEARVEAGVNAGVWKKAVNSFDVFDIINEQRVRFVAAHGVVDPAALVASVRHSPMANLLLSVAIEESRGDPVAVGAAGEQGAWQVKSVHWGGVPKDLHGQAGQAERIISALLDSSNGNKIRALARYNGGTTPPGKSYRYAERILKREGRLHVAVNYLPPKVYKSGHILPGLPGTPRFL